MQNYDQSEECIKANNRQTRNLKQKFIEVWRTLNIEYKISVIAKDRISTQYCDKLEKTVYSSVEIKKVNLKRNT